MSQLRPQELITSRYTEAYKEIERLFTQLLDNPACNLSAAEKSEVCRFIYVGEYGLALETAIAVFEDEAKSVAAETLTALRRLAETMSLDADALLDQLMKRGAPSPP